MGKMQFFNPYYLLVSEDIFESLGLNALKEAFPFNQYFCIMVYSGSVAGASSIETDL